MNTKLLKVLQDKCKDFGLTDKAIEELAETASEGLNDDASDEDITKVADSLIPTAKIIQGEITRKTRKTAPKTKTTPKKAGDDDDEGAGDDDEGDDDGKNPPAWFRKYKKQNDAAVKALQDENAALKAEKARVERRNAITLKAKELEIPDFLMKRFSIADDADIEKELKEYKQDLVTNKLMPADKADILSSSQKAMEDDADEWAKSLPDNKTD
ncbi:MAG: hypothetical protein IJ887_00515 [Prevotella sp.]|nr:hypothetical protein [Prevotella sp.]